MSRLKFFDAVTLALVLALGNFAYQWVFAVSPNWREAVEHTWWQAWTLLIAWGCWREPKQKAQRRGEGPGFCD